MGRKYNTRKRASNRRKKTKKQKTYKFRKGGTKYNSYLEFPHRFTYQDITDNIGDIEELENPKDIISYEIDKVYLIQFTDDNQFYYQYRVKNIVDDEIFVIPVIPKGKKYSRLKPRQIYVNNIEYSYVVLPKYDNNTYYDTQKEVLDTNPGPFGELPPDMSNEIFRYVKR